MINWGKIAIKILKIFGVTESNFPNFEYLTKSNATYLIRGTQFNVNRNVIYFFVDPNAHLYDLMFSLAHECWHVKQKADKIDIKYSNNHAKSYGHTRNHMFMLLYYPFENEAHSFSRCLVYYYLKLMSEIGIIKNKEKEISIYSMPDYPTINDVDSEKDVADISKLLDINFDKAKMYFNKKTENDCSIVRKNLEEINLKEIVDNPNSIPLLKKMAICVEECNFINFLYDIHLELKD